MAKKPQKNTVNNALENYLFNQIKDNVVYQIWEKNFTLPSEITDNLSRTLRDYQIEAVKHFIYLFENDPAKARHLLFNMATGTGKTLVMAAVVLYLFTKGYQNFIFLVHQLQIKNQAEKNFTDSKFEKYLFNPKGVKIGGKKIEIKSSDDFSDSALPRINFMFFSTAGLYNALTKDSENSLALEDFQKNKTVILADEAHRLNVDTRKKKTKTEEAEIQNWETAVQSALNGNLFNLLLEFTATVDFQNKAILEKYRDKLIYRYDFSQFNQDQYSKEVKPLYNQATQAADQKRQLIVNAVVLSEYRKLFAASNDIILNPIVLVKSINIKQSQADRIFFNEVIDSLTPQDFQPLKELAKENPDISQMFSWIGDFNRKTHRLAELKEKTGLINFIARIKEDFAPDYCLEYNSQRKENPELLAQLDDPRNVIRAVFSVNALNEGWDVLSLFDIVHFDISATKKVSLQDIQLIGRGARLFPYDLPKSYGGEGFFASSFDRDRYKRKFDRSPQDRGRILETMFYHFVKTGNFLEKLQNDLLGEGIIKKGAVKRTLRLKESFIKSATYEKGFVLMNQRAFRKAQKITEIGAILSRRIEVRPYRLHAHSLTDREENAFMENLSMEGIFLTEAYFSYEILRKALMAAEGNFFRFDQISQHIVGLESIDSLIKDYLPLFEIIYEYEKTKPIEALTLKEKFHLLVNAILPEIRKVIDLSLPRMVGSTIFYPVPVSEIFSKIKDIWIMGENITDPLTGKVTEQVNSERAIGQVDHPDETLRCDLSLADWYGYNENYGTSEEKYFVKFIQSQIETLKERFKGCEIYLLRNELEYCVFNLEDGAAFSPDYLLFINDVSDQALYYQCLFEAKGDHLLQHDAWKQKGLLEITAQSKAEIPEKPILVEIKGKEYLLSESFLDSLRKENYQEIKCLGFEFFNETNKFDFQKNFDSVLSA